MIQILLIQTIRNQKVKKSVSQAGVSVIGYAVTCVTVEPVGYASFWRVNVSMRNREPGCVTELRNHA